MQSNYLIVDRRILPDYYEKVVQARDMLREGRVKEVSEAVKLVGISRSTYYKYKDRIIEPSELNIGHKATLMLTLTHEAGNLSRVLNEVSAFGANILTITQSLPLHGTASIMISLDTNKMEHAIEQLIDDLQRLEGVEKVRLLAVE